MPTTSNFGWTTPADTDLVKDGAAAIRTLGNGIDTSLLDLKGGTSGQVLSKNSNTDLDFAWVAQDDSNAIQNALLTTTGDTIYASGASTPARLGIGTSGQVLTVVGGVPAWAAPAGGGKVLQVVQATYSTATTVTSLTMTDTGLSGTITPSSASSKVLVLVSQPVWMDRITSLAGMNLRLMRASTRIYGSPDTGGGGADSGYSQASGSTRIQFRWNYTITYLDSPATTSATTYKTQFNVQDTANSGSVTAQGNDQVGSIILLEIGA
jgi:hypothetical protein